MIFGGKYDKEGHILNFLKRGLN